MADKPVSERRAVKVSFELDSNEWHGKTVERLWASKLSDGSFRVDNIPFYACDVSCEDVVITQPRGDELVFSRVLSRGGHSTYRILIVDSEDPDQRFLKYWHMLEDKGCSFEGNGEGLYAIDVPPRTRCEEVYEILEQVANAGLWDFEEAHYGHG